jgi:hypothetical protein
MAQSVATVRKQMSQRAKEPATKGLFNFVGRVFAVLVGLLLLPGAVYWAMLISSRFVR